MARGRFISKGIASDRGVNWLSSDTCRLAFTWMIAMADSEGRITGEPDLLLATLFPRRQDITCDIMELFIQEWVEAGFVVWYLAEDGDRYLQLINFNKHQVGLRKDREPGSEIPAPEVCKILGGSLPDDCRKDDGKLTEDERKEAGEMPAEVKAEVKEEVKGKGEAEAESPTGPGGTQASVANVFRVYESEIGVLTGSIDEMLKSALEDYPEEWIKAALLECSRHNKRNWSYAQSILKRWKVDGFQSQKKAVSGSAPRALTGLDAVKAEMDRLGMKPSGIFDGDIDE